MRWTICCQVLDKWPSGGAPHVLLRADGMEDDEKEYIEGHGTVPPPQTVSKSGPRRRGGDDLLGGAAPTRLPWTPSDLTDNLFLGR